MAPSQKKALIIVGALVIVLAISFFGFYAKQQIDEAKAANEQLMLQNEQLQLAGEYEQLSNEFKNYESQTQFLNNDSIILKYSEAKDKVEKLLTELKTQKITSDKRIKELQDEIKTLRSIMRHYVQIIDSLSRENAGLKAENEEIKTRNKQLSSQVSRVNQENKDLSERMTLAEKLNVTGVTLTPLKSNGKTEKRITKANNCASCSPFRKTTLPRWAKKSFTCALQAPKDICLERTAHLNLRVALSPIPSARR